jgi:hypothetical protein
VEFRVEELTIREYYLARHYDALWTNEEFQAAEAFLLDGKLKRLPDDAVVEGVKGDLAGSLRLRLSDPAVVELFRKGRKRFYRGLVERLLRDHSNELPRCPKCNWLLPTGRAQQCSECGYDWHMPNDERPQGSPAANQPGG